MKVLILIVSEIISKSFYMITSLWLYDSFNVINLYSTGNSLFFCVLHSIKNMVKALDPLH